MEKNYAGKRFLNVEAFQILSEKASAEADDFDIIEDVVKSCTAYVQDVDVGETQIRRFYATLDGEELRERVTAIDKRRKAHHETAIANCKLLNRLAELYGVSKVFTGDAADRLQVADFCLDVTVSIFENRRK